MGVIKHEVDIAQFDDDRPEQYAALVAWRDQLLPQWRALVVGPVTALVNGYVWFVMLPDGSKEGWNTSDDGDRYRDEFRRLAAGSQYGYGIVRVTFGDEPAAVREA